MRFADKTQNWKGGGVGGLVGGGGESMAGARGELMEHQTARCQPSEPCSPKTVQLSAACVVLQDLVLSRSVEVNVHHTSNFTLIYI